MMAFPHVGYILAAYGATVVILGGTIAAILVDRRTLTRSLAKLESRAGRGRGEAPR